MDPKPDLNDLEILCAVVDTGSFRAAADFVGTSQPTVSRAISRLEDRLQEPLVRRNSRSVAPTALGLQYAERARQLLREFQEVEAELLGGGSLAGAISLSAPPSLGRRILAGPLSAFGASHPAVRLNISFENRRVDLVDERVDIAVRFGPLQPTWRRKRLLLRGKFHVYGAAEFQALAGVGVRQLLDRAPCLVLHSTHLRDRWPFVLNGRLSWQEVEPSLTANDVDALIAFAQHGSGVTLLPDFMVEHEVARGELVQLTESDVSAPTEVFAMTGDEWRSERVEALLDHLVTSLAQDQTGASA